MAELNFNPAAFVLALPEMNGEFEAGIAAGGDLSVPESEKLSVFPESIEQGYTPQKQVLYRAYMSAVWALRKVEFGSQSDWYIRGAFNAVFFGMIGTIQKGNQRIHDGDFILQTNALHPPPTKGEMDRVTSLVAERRFEGALTLQVAGKANFYQTNHHTGESMTKATGYTKKAMLVVLQSANPDQVKMVHTISHWCSTICILRLAEIPNMRTDFQSVINNAKHFTLTPDARLRFASSPSGTARYAVVSAGIEKLKNHELAAYFGPWAGLVTVKQMAGTLLAQGAAAHIGASYLTNAPRYPFNDDAAAGVLGRVGTFIRVLHPNSTLANTPHFSIQNVESADDYSKTWKDMCEHYSRALRNALNQIEINVQVRLTNEELIAMRNDLN